MLGELTTTEIERLLETEQTGRLGVTDGTRVYIMPVSYGYDGKAVYVVSHEGLKVRLMRAHPEVCFEVEQIETPARWRTVIAHGRYEEIRDQSARDAALALIGAQAKAGMPPSVAPFINGAERLVVYRIALDEKSGRYERDEVFRSAPAGRG